MPVSVSRHPPTASACPADRPSSGSVLRLKLAYRYWHMIRCSSCDASTSRLHRCSRFSTTSSGSDIGAPNMVALSPPSRLTSLHADATAEGAACTIPGWLPPERLAILGYDDSDIDARERHLLALPLSRADGGQVAADPVGAAAAARRHVEASAGAILVHFDVDAIDSAD